MTAARNYFSGCVEPTAVLVDAHLLMPATRPPAHAPSLAAAIARIVADDEGQMR